MKKGTTPILSDEILKRIPPDINIFDYLTDALSLSKESVYRRLRGIIPFSFEEVMILSTKLDLSMDELLKGSKSNQAIINIENNMLTGTEDGFITIFRNYNNSMQPLRSAKENQIVMSINRILCIFTFPFQNLFKFYYYKWMHQYGNTPLNYYYSDVSIPSELNELRQNNSNYSDIQNIVFILDKNIFYNTVQEIKYYTDRGLINKNDVQLIKEDLMDFLEKFYLFSLNNTDGSTRCEVYLSSLNIENNIAYVAYDDTLSSYYWMHSDNYVYSFNPELCLLQKDWLDSLKKYSILISQSNQKMQAELYNDILKHLEMLSE